MSLVTVGVGNIVRDPEVRPAGSAQVASFTIASNRNFQKDGEWVSIPTYLDVKAWGKLAESAQRFTKGQEVMVYGELEQEKWTDKTSGESRSKLVLNAQRIKKVGGKKEQSEDSSSSESESDSVPF